MRYRITVEGASFEVEVGSLEERPVIATVDGEPFEVWPEDLSVSGNAHVVRPGSRAEVLKDVDTSLPPMSSMPGQVDYDIEHPAATAPTARSKSVLAPIPGSIIAISVEPGDDVSVGQELCVLDAMKMESPIRASRAGRIARVLVSEGQSVKHHQLLMEYAD